MKIIWNTIRIFIVCAFLTGIVYPLAVMACAQLFFKDKANGGLLAKDGKYVGATLVGQHFIQDGYFWGRPSAGQYETFPSVASNLSIASETVRENVTTRRALYGAGLGADEMLFSSASGIDPHISPAAAQVQVARVARARGVDEATLLPFINQFTRARDLGFLGEPSVNVLQLNLALDEQLRP